MNITHLKNTLRVLARACITTFIMGIHGIGKSSVVYQLHREIAEERDKLPKQMKGLVLSKESVEFSCLSSIDAKTLIANNNDLDVFGLWAISAANTTSEELIGMPKVTDMDEVYRRVWVETMKPAAMMAQGDFEAFKKHHHELFEYSCSKLGLTEDDRGRVILHYLRMHALMPDPRHRGGGIWIVDELNTAFIEVEKAFWQIFLEGRYLDYILPKDIWVVTTMNPPCPSYPGARELALPTIDRGALLTVSPNKEEWAKWAVRRGLSDTSRMFVDKHDAKLLNPVKSEVKLDDFKNPGTYRSIELVDRAYKVMTDKEIDEVGVSVAESLLGPEAATVYHREYKETVHQPLRLDDVIKGYGWRKDMTREQEMDYKSWKVTKPRTRLKAMVQRTNVKAELIQFTLGELAVWVEDLHETLEARGSTKESPKHTDEERGQILNMLLFLHDLPVDIARGFILQDVDSRYGRLMYWTGRYPLTRSLYDRIETDFQEAVSGGA